MLNIDKNSIFNILVSKKDLLLATGVKKIGLFGSFIRNEQNFDSDIDILVEFKKGQKTLHNLTVLGELLESWFDRKVDLVTPESLSPFIGPHIINEVQYAPFTG